MSEQPRFEEIIHQSGIVPVSPDDELGGRAEGLDDEGAVGQGDELVGLEDEGGGRRRREEEFFVFVFLWGELTEPRWEGDEGFLLLVEGTPAPENFTTKLISAKEGRGGEGGRREPPVAESLAGREPRTQTPRGSNEEKVLGPGSVVVVVN